MFRVILISLTLFLVSQSSMAALFKCRLLNPCANNHPMALNECIFETMDIVVSKTNKNRASLYAYKENGNTRRFWGDIDLGNKPYFSTDARFTPIQIYAYIVRGDMFAGYMEYKDAEFKISCKYKRDGIDISI